MDRKGRTRKPQEKTQLVRFSFGENTYEIDPNRHKVYRRFVEVEAAKAAAIYSTWRSRHLDG